MYQCTPPGQQAVGETEASQTLRGMGVLGAMSTEGAGLEGLASVTARWVSPESLRLNVPDHDRVDELPLSVVGAEPARHIPAASTGVLGTAGPGIICTRSAPPRNQQDKLWWPESVQGRGEGTCPAWPTHPSPEDPEHTDRSRLERKLHPPMQGQRARAAHRSRSSSASTELHRCRPTWVTRARMSLPGKEPAPSLQRGKV